MQVQISDSYVLYFLISLKPIIKVQLLLLNYKTQRLDFFKGG